MLTLSRVQLFATPGTVPRQAPLSMGSPGKNPGAGYHFLLQGIFPTQGSSPRLLSRTHIADGFFTTEPLGKRFGHLSINNTLVLRNIWTPKQTVLSGN